MPLGALRNVDNSIRKTCKSCNITIFLLFEVDQRFIFFGVCSVTLFLALGPPYFVRKGVFYEVLACVRTYLLVPSILA